MEMWLIRFLLGFNTYFVLWLAFWKDKYFLQFPSQNKFTIEIWKRNRSWEGMEWSERTKVFNLKFWNKW